MIQKQKAIGTKLRLIGISFLVLMISLIAITTYLNEKNEKDGLIINIAGKQRMLTQKISKYVFYSYYNSNDDFSKLDEASKEFAKGLNTLINGDEKLGISKAPTRKILDQLNRIKSMWEIFSNNIDSFKKMISLKSKRDDKILHKNVKYIYNNNMPLLNEVDKMVSIYTNYVEKKSHDIRNIQYLFALLLCILLIYNFFHLKTMEENAKKFIEMSKNLSQDEKTNQIKPILIEAEEEIVEASHAINNFIQKVNSAVEYSTNASSKLEEISLEFDKIIAESNHNEDTLKTLDQSEDIVIESQEELTISTKKLEKLKKDLNYLLDSLNK